jgi:hypothetical protein
MNPAEVIYNKIKEGLDVKQDKQLKSLSPEVSGSDVVCYDYHFKTINVIDNIRVHARMITRHYTDGRCEMILDITLAHIKKENGSSVDLFTKWYYRKKKQFSIILVEEVLLDFKDILKKLKFDKLNSHLKTEIIDEGFGDEYKSKNKCCVCLEPTNQETNCRHFLCLQCFDNLKEQNCPVCRNKRLFTHLFEESDDDKEEED